MTTDKPIDLKLDTFLSTQYDHTSSFEKLKIQVSTTEIGIEASQEQLKSLRSLKEEI